MRPSGRRPVVHLYVCCLLFNSNRSNAFVPAQNMSAKGLCLLLSECVALYKKMAEREEEDFCSETAGVYVLCNLDNRRTYVGATKNFMHRLRQHNREITGGARSTAGSTTWHHRILVTGFVSWSHALSFEWYVHKYRHFGRGAFAGFTSPPLKSKLRRIQLLIDKFGDTKFPNLTVTEVDPPSRDEFLLRREGLAEKKRKQQQKRAARDLAEKKVVEIRRANAWHEKVRRRMFGGKQTQRTRERKMKRLNQNATGIIIEGNVGGAQEEKDGQVEEQKQVKKQVPCVGPAGSREAQDATAQAPAGDAKSVLVEGAQNRCGEADAAFSPQPVAEPVAGPVAGPVTVPLAVPVAVPVAEPVERQEVRHPLRDERRGLAEVHEGELAS